MVYYKVVDDIAGEVIINTDEINYSLSLKNYDAYEPILHFITNSSKRLDLPLDFYFSLFNGLTLWGDLYIQQIEK